MHSAESQKRARGGKKNYWQLERGRQDVKICRQDLDMLHCTLCICMRHVCKSSYGVWPSGAGSVNPHGSRV